MTKKLTILADENIPDLQSFCGNWADITLMPGREISAKHLSNIDILFVRSVTQVNAALLGSSNIRFVASATIGLDHIDKCYLKQQNIGFAYAPGCNANAVVDYVMASIFHHYSNELLQTLKVGIVGYGNVGSRLAKCLQHFDLDYRFYDPLIDPPFLPESQTAKKTLPRVASLDKLLDCDIISLHVPITRTGLHPTYHLINQDILAKLPNGSLMINSSRGPVVDNTQLKNALEQRVDISAVLDVWEGEPNIDLDLYSLCSLATAHIAGYSIEGKRRGTTAIVNAAMDYFAINKNKIVDDQSGYQLQQFTSLAEYRTALESVYQLKQDSDNFKAAFVNSKNKAAAFDHYRKTYPLRSEINYSND